MAVNPRYDAVVIGAGAGGAAAAWRLCDQGLKVLLLEAGPRFIPWQDFKLYLPDWERHTFPTRPGSQGKFSLGEFSSLDPEERELRSWSAVTGAIARGGIRQPSGPGYWHVQGVGGSTLAFVGEAHRMHPEAMKMQSRFGAGHDWPITYADLEPYYTQCEQLIGVAGPAEHEPRWRSAPFPLPPHPLSPSAQRLQAAGSRLGMNWQANARAVLSAVYDDRPYCNYCGNCSRGCPLGDKGSADVTFIRKAEQTGRLTLKTNSRLVRLNPARDERIASIEYVFKKTIHRVETPLLILAAGAIQTPRILLSNKDRRHSTGLSNSSGQVGRNFMDTLYWSSTGILPDLTNSHMGLPADAICWDFNGPQGIPGVVGGCRFNSGVQEIGLVGPIAYASRVVKGFGKDLKEGLRNNFGRCITVGAIGEFLPNEMSFVDLDPSQKDEFGVPLPRIHSHLGPTEILRLRFMASQARKLLKEAGVSELVEEYGTWDLFSATHVFGTCRMGNSAENSVVNAFGCSHDHPNLFITDASVFPSTGGGESPALTIQALALRTVDSILAA